MSFRKQYEKHGPDQFYEHIGENYINPHREYIANALYMIFKNFRIPLNRMFIDLACGSGEVTKALVDLGVYMHNIVAIDPYLDQVYKRRYLKNCYKLSFQDIIKSAEQSPFDWLKKTSNVTVICSYALHLIEKSERIRLLQNLTTIAFKLIILSPTKNVTTIQPEWGWSKIGYVKSNDTHGFIGSRNLFAGELF